MVQERRIALRVSFRVSLLAVFMAASGCAEHPSGVSADTDSEVLLRGNGTVLQASEHDDPELCLGVIADSLPPQCGGIPIEGWDWDAVEGEETVSGVTWGDYEVVGTYDGGTFQLHEVVGPPTFEEGEEVDFTAPCATPEGGWVALDPSKATRDHFTAAMHGAEAQPDSTAVWIDYVQEPVGEETGPFIGVFGFTGDLERHEAELRDLWGGPMCVFQQSRPFQELQRIQSDLGEGGAAAVGLEQTYSSIDVRSNVVEVGAIVTNEHIEQALAERYGEGSVHVVPALVPA